jgi:hypothetical protein
MTTEEKLDRTNSCNLFQFLAGFLYFEKFDPSGVFELANRYDFDFEKINTLAFNAMFTASIWGQFSPARPSLNNPQARRQNYEFCKISSGYCSIVTFSFVDAQPNWAISETYFALTNGACSDQISPRLEDW